MKTKNIILTYLTDALPFVIIMIIGIFKSKVFIMNLNMNTIGLYQLYSSLIGYVSIFEFGFSGALLYRLFKPIKEQDANRINKLFSMGVNTYKYVGLMMLGMGILLSFFIPSLIKDNPFNLAYIITTFLLYISTNIIYYNIVSYKLLIDAKEKKYITNLVVQISEIIKGILEIIVLIVFKNLIAVLLVAILTTSISSILIVYFCKKEYPKLKKVKYSKNEIIIDLKDLFVHKIAYLVNNNVDLVLITKYFGLKKVVVYSTYMFICNALKRLLIKMYTSIVPSIGNILVEDVKKAKELFFEINHFILFVATIVSSSLLVAINPFIKIFYEGKIETSAILAISFSILIFTSMSSMPYSIMIDAKGLFKSTKRSAIFEAMCNLGLSLLLISKFGIFGIIISTAVAIYISNILKCRIIFKEVFASSFKDYIKETIVLTLIAIIYAVVLFFSTKHIILTNLFNWLVVNLFLFIASTLIIYIVYKLKKHHHFINRFKNIFKRKRA